MKFVEGIFCFDNDTFNKAMMQQEFSLKFYLFCLFFAFFVVQEVQAQGKIDHTFWEVRNGTASFTMEQGIIIGTSKLHSPNTFLCTKNVYSDFILDVDFWVDSTLNSGIQIRSNSLPEYLEGVVHGYQIEIDPSTRGWTGGIYDEQRRGWLTPVLDNRSKDAFKQHDWNHFHIEAFDNRIRVWLNGVMISNLLDDFTTEGFIGLQVHSINNINQSGKQIKWKNFHLLTENLEDHLIPTDPKAPEVNLIADYLSEKEVEDRWLLIGTENTALEFIGNDLGFELSFEVNAQELTSAQIEYGWHSSEKDTQVDFQYIIQDDRVLKDATDSNQSMASLLNRVASINILFPDRKKEVRPDGFWQQGKIICTPGKIEHWLNGFLVVVYTPEKKIDLSTENWQSFFRFPNTDSVRFRNIKYRPAKADRKE